MISFKSETIVHKSSMFSRVIDAFTNSIGLIPFILGPLIVSPPTEPVAMINYWTNYVTLLLCFSVWHTLECLITNYFTKEGNTAKVLVSVLGGGFLLACFTITRDKFVLSTYSFPSIVGAIGISAARYSVATSMPKISLLCYFFEVYLKTIASIFVLHGSLPTMPAIYAALVASAVTGGCKQIKSNKAVSVLLTIPPLIGGFMGLLKLLPSPFVSLYLFVFLVPVVVAKAEIATRKRFFTSLYIWLLGIFSAGLRFLLT